MDGKWNPDADLEGDGVEGGAEDATEAVDIDGGAEKGICVVVAILLTYRQ